MKRNAIRWFAAILIIAFFTSACSKDTVDRQPTETPNVISESEKGDTPDTQGVTTFAYFPTSIDVTLENDSAASAIIGLEGGSLNAIDSNGTEYTLTIPEGALMAEEEITMTPIANAEGEGIGDTFIAGVDLQPEGLHFLELVSIEITGNVIEEGAVAFAAQNGGEDFRVTPSNSGGGSMTITTTHFSDFGASIEEIRNGLGELGEFAGDNYEAWVDVQLTLGNTSQVMTAFEKWTDILLDKGQSEMSLNEWRSWTADMLTLIMRVDERGTEDEWDSSTPGFTNLTTKMQNLIDLWFQQTDKAINSVTDKCILGEIDYLSKGIQIINVSNWLVANLTLGTDKREQADHWLDLLIDSCLHLGVLWQANVVTTGTDATPFTSDISIGTQVDQGLNLTTWAKGYHPVHLTSGEIDLGVEYIDGFWDQKCVPNSGMARVKLIIEKFDYNLGFEPGLVEGITVYVKIDKPVYIDCAPAGTLYLWTTKADAQAPFHGGALDIFNKDRVEEVDGEDWWKFSLKYDPGGGIVAQYEEGPKTLSWSGGKYELWQLLTVYQPTPVNP